MQERLKQKTSRKKKALTAEKIEFSEDKIQAMKNLAQQIAKTIAPVQAEEKLVAKSSVQVEIDEERKRKLEEKEQLKTLTPVELRELNRKKLEKVDDGDTNKIDDLNTNVSFSKALEVTEETAQLYHKAKKKKKDVAEEIERYTKIVEKVAIEGKIRKNKHKNKIVDTSSKIDGEVVEGVVKKEINKQKDKESTKRNLTQDDYVLNKLFSKKGNEL